METEKKIDLNFCNLIYSSKDTDIEYEKESLIEAYEINKNFAKTKIPKFDIKIVYSREEFEKIWESKTPDFVSAFTKNNGIVIFSYGIFDKETRWEKDKFKDTLLHEINHLFYQELRDDEYDPLWLSEGLATFMQHGKKKFNYKNRLEIKREILEQPFEKMTIESYQVFTLLVEYLILEFGEDKILKLIDELKQGNKLEDIFQEIYKKSFNALIECAN